MFNILFNYEVCQRCGLFCLFCVFTSASQAKGTEGRRAKTTPGDGVVGHVSRQGPNTEGDERQQISTGFRIRRLNINNARMLDLSIASRALFTESQYFTKHPHLLCAVYWSHPPLAGTQDNIYQQALPHMLACPPCAREFARVSPAFYMRPQPQTIRERSQRPSNGDLRVWTKARGEI